jgi:energy-converting hydrogenase B subunit D
MFPLLDGVLAVGLLGLAWAAVMARDALKASVLFIVFTLVLSLAWVRLAAPDIALAEAAIGAGVTGALLIDTVGRIRRRDRQSRDRQGSAEGDDLEQGVDHEG